MTAQQLDIFDAIAQADSHHRGARSLVANDPRVDEAFARFVDALYAAAHVDAGRWLISQNDLRLQLVEQTQQGPRCSIEHHLYAGFFGRAKAEGLIRVALDGFNQKIHDTCVTSFTGNNGKPQLMYELLTRT
jgi:hypothetical protein